MTSLEELIGRQPCCPQDTGGSHYHCGRCGGVSGMQGHYCAVHIKPGGGIVRTDFHFHCPEPYGCALTEATAASP